MDMILWLIGTLIVVLGPIILIHELGHFIFAKLAGVRVEEFGLGFPPRLLKLWRGKGYLEIGTTRVVIPVGFRLPAGLKAGPRVDAVVRRRDDGTTVLERLTVLDSTADDRPVESEAAPQELHVRGALTTLEPGTLYSLNLLPMGAFVKMTGEEDPSDPRSLAAQPKRWRVAVMAAGAVLNILVALLLLVGAYTSGYPEKWVVEVTTVEPASAAEVVGLQPHDIILAAGGERIKEGLAHLQHIIRAAPEQTIELIVLRQGETLTLTTTPGRSPEGYGYLGIWMAPWPDRSALAFSLQQSIEWGLAFPMLQTASLISLALGMTNLLPLPALDGGRILFVLIEAVRGRRISPDREAVIHFVGLVILVSLMAFAMLQDVVNPIIPWSWLR